MAALHAPALRSNLGEGGHARWGGDALRGLLRRVAAPAGVELRQTPVSMPMCSIEVCQQAINPISPLPHFWAIDKGDFPGLPAAQTPPGSPSGLIA